jgi:chromosome segregation ATPase
LLQFLTNSPGRASDLAKFVKRGKTEEEAFVEVDILEDTGSVVTIRRTINAQSNSSKWHINGTQRPLTEAKKIIERFHIDVDNLCSFMPQDKVGKFTQYSPKEVLQNTLKSIKENPDDHSSIDLFTEQEELSNSQTLKENLRKSKDAKALHKEHLSKQIGTLSLEMDRLKQKDKARETKKFYEIKLLKVKGSEQKKQVAEMKQSLETISNQLMTYQDKVAPYETTIREYKKQESKVIRQEQTVQGTLQEVQKQMEVIQKEIQVCDEEKDRYSVELANFETLRQRSLDEFNQKKSQLKKLIDDKAKVEKKIENYEAEMASVQKRRAEIQAEQDEHQQLILNAEEKQSNCHEELKSINHKLGSLQDAREVFKSRLANHPDRGNPIFQHTIKAMNYLDKEEANLRESGQITGEIVGPVALSINTKDPAIAMMVEAAVAQNRLLGYLVTNDRDALCLKNIFRKQLKLQIDIFTIKNANAHPRLPYAPDYLKNIMNSIRGVKGYVFEQIQCPDIVKSFLFSFNALHTMLWGRGEGMSDNMTGEQLSMLCPQGMPAFRLFVHDEGSKTTSSRSMTPGRGGNNSFGKVTDFNGRRSRYATNAPPSTSTSRVQPKGIISDFQSGAGGTSAEDGAQQNPAEIKQQYQQRKEEISNELQKVNTLLIAARQKDDELKNEAQRLKGKATELNKVRSQPQALERQIQMLTKQLQADEKKLTQEVYLKEKEAKQSDFAQTIDTFLDRIDSLTQGIHQFSLRRIDKRVCATLKHCAQEKTVFLENEMNHYKTEINNLRKQKDLKEREVKRLETDLHNLNEEMNDIIAQCGGYDTFVRDIFPRVIQECPENTLEEIEDKLMAVETMIQKILDNPQVVERYNALEREFSEICAELEKSEKELNDAESVLTDRSKKWLAAVESLTKKLDHSFSAYMKGLKFDGEVVLKPIGKFIDYELQLRVSFRENHPCSDLSGSRHSGGERAVSTIMFLMALQQMTSSPFRVVDEINQGMDERNERLVFDRIVKSCCDVENGGGRHNTQYFLVTPKLLQGLRCLDHDQVTVLLIWNGPGIEEKWNLSTVIENLERKRKGLLRDKLKKEMGEESDFQEEEEEMIVKKEVHQPKKLLKIK